MKRELQNALAAEFPFMDQKPEPGERFGMNLFHSFGVDTGDGWYELIRGLCREITEAYERAALPVDIVVDQIKEKYGTLRFYWSREGEPLGIQAIDASGLRARIPHPDTGIGQEIDRIVDKWEKVSGTVCEDCGAPGELRTDLAWILTLCDNCHEKEKSAERTKTFCRGSKGTYWEQMNGRKDENA